MNKKGIVWFGILFIAFAVSSFVGVYTGLTFLPFVVWLLIAISIIVTAANKSKKVKNNNKYDEKVEMYKKMCEDKMKEKEDFQYDRCDNDECDSHDDTFTKKCPLCATVNDANAKYCKICGEELDKDIF